MNASGREKAIVVLEHCSKQTVFYASGLPGGYEAIWARDSMISSLGASLAGDKFQIPFRKSLELLSKNQSELGQIPNAVGSYNIERQSDITYNSIDSTLWYLIGHRVYAKAHGDTSVLEKYQKNVEKALLWLRYQDPNEDKLIVQQPTMDWQDAFPHKYGRVLNTQALYYAVLSMYGEKKLATHIRRVVNGEIEEYLSLYDKKRGYYLPWIWKNHDGDREQEEWFDTLGNLLAIVSGLATPKIAQSILDHVERNKVNRPYPCRAIDPPLKPEDKEWHSYFEKCDAKTPHEYSNAGIWPFIGGFYIAALVKAGRHEKAEQELGLLAKANKLGNEQEWEFHEWLHGKTGQIGHSSAPFQAWSAGAYIFALESVSRKSVPYF